MVFTVFFTPLNGCWKNNYLKLVTIAAFFWGNGSAISHFPMELRSGLLRHQPNIALAAAPVGVKIMTLGMLECWVLSYTSPEV